MAKTQGRGKSTAAAARRSKQNNRYARKESTEEEEDEYESDEDEEFWDELFMWLLKLLTVLSVALTTLLIYQSYMLGTVHYQGLSVVTNRLSTTSNSNSNSPGLSHHHMNNKKNYNSYDDNDDWNIFVMGDGQSPPKAVQNPDDIIKTGKNSDGAVMITRASNNNQHHQRKKESFSNTNSGATAAADQLFDTTNNNLNPLKTTVAANHRFLEDEVHPDLLRVAPQHHRKAGYSYKYYYYDELQQTFRFSSLYKTMLQQINNNHNNNQNNNNNNHHDQHYPTQKPLPTKAQPSLCKDNINYGYSDYPTLKLAIDELNHRYSQSMEQWFDYQAAMTEYELILFLHFSSNQQQQQQQQHQQDDVKVDKPPNPPSQPNELPMPEPIQICPGATIQSKQYAPSSYYQHSYHNNPAMQPSNPSQHQHPSPINGYNPMFTINAPHVWIQCDNCNIDSTTTHLSFGPYARGVLIKGLHFSGATTGSLIFHSHGADVNFEDCSWTENTALGNTGAVADMNSTSSVKFYRCEITDAKQYLNKGQPGFPSGFTSSLTIRN